MVRDIMTDKKKYNFKCFETECSNRVCCTRPEVNVTTGDLSRWTVANVLQHIMGALELKVPQGEGEIIRMVTVRKPLESDPEKTACALYHEESNNCTIRYIRPISCRTFPLQYNGEKFYVSNKQCPGIGEGDVTKEALKEAKELAEEEYEERVETQMALPAIYGMIMAQMIKQSQEAMKNMSPEDLEKLEEMMQKQKQDEPEEEETE
ncbi:MAG: hypothetical protein GF411_04560 [Candidatus Lokiarchaeota archaeon]|nr:hypothetical protein [Candidatus Lokiarchaeota archaeon]